jgi:ADP-heptose:LPS heptosyltransferase
LLAEGALTVVVLAGPADAEPATALSRALGGLGARLANAPLADVVALLADARLYVGNDSGTSHVAAAVGAPTVAIFGPTRPARWAPRGPRVAVVEPLARCPACRAADERPADCACLLAVGPETVIEAATLLAR